MRILAWCGSILAGGTACALFLEAAARLVGGLGPGGSRLESGGIILCVGDSYMRGPEDPDSYPAVLERLLQARTGRPYRVVNLGVPGMNTAQMRSRFARYLAYYRPSLVLLQGGFNNARNPSEAESWRRGPLADFAEHSRLLNLARVWRQPARPASEVLAPPAPALQSWEHARGTRWHVAFAGRPEDIPTPGTAEPPPPDRLYSVTRDDLEAMMRQAAALGVPVYLVTYPLWIGEFETANRAMADAATAWHVPFAEAGRALDRLAGEGLRPPELFDPWGHPAPALYRAMAEEVDRVLAAVE